MGSPYEYRVTPGQNNNPQPSMAELESELENAIRDLYIEAGLSPPDVSRPGPSQDLSMSSSSEDSAILELSPSSLKAMKEKEERRSKRIPVETERRGKLTTD